MLRAFKAVLWAFLGVRKQSEYEADAAQVKPVQFIVVGLALALIFVVALVFLVRTLSPSKQMPPKQTKPKTASVALEKPSRDKLSAFSKTIHIHPHLGDFRG
jgi:flagellar biogenesis protein FliO